MSTEFSKKYLIFSLYFYAKVYTLTNILKPLQTPFHMVLFPQKEVVFMKDFTVKSCVYSSADGCDRLALSDDGLHIRDVVIHAGIGQEIMIGFLSDLHYNFCNQHDLDEGDPVIISTLEHRRWLANGASVPTARKCLEFLDDADQIILGGDTLDYLSHGAMELMQREIWDKYPGIIATVGGHELARKMQGTVDDPLPRELLIATVRQFWKHDIYYTAKLIKDNVLVVGLMNDLSRFNEDQYQKLAADISLAREKGYILLLFAHEPIATHDPAHKHITGSDVIMVGDPCAFPGNYCDGHTAGGEFSDAPTKAMYELITNSADVVKGFFSGHVHSHMYLEIAATLPDGTPTVIPQYIHTATAYQGGHLMRILVR